MRRRPSAGEQPGPGEGLEAGGAEDRRVLGGSGVLGPCVSFFFQLRCSLTALLEA